MTGVYCQILKLDIIYLWRNGICRTCKSACTAELIVILYSALLRFKHFDIDISAYCKVGDSIIRIACVKLAYISTLFKQVMPVLDKSVEQT